MLGDAVLPVNESALARRYFFYYLGRLCPDAFLNLVKGSWPPFLELVVSVGSHDELALEQRFSNYPPKVARFLGWYRSMPQSYLPDEYLGWERLCAISKDEFPEVNPLGESLVAWGDQYNLCFAWCMDTALNSLLELLRRNMSPAFASLTPKRLWSPPFPLGLSLAPQERLDFAFSLGETVEDPMPGLGGLNPLVDERYQPNTESRKQAEKRIRDRFEAELQRYLDEVERAYRDLAGAEIRPAEKPKTIGSEKVAWLVRYQCLNEAFAEIARQEQLHPESVAEPARQLAQLVGLDLRRANRGRPPGSRDSHVRWRRG